MNRLDFFMDVSPDWWRKARINESFLKQYVFEKFDRDYYPRIVAIGRRGRKIDLDESGKLIKERIIEILRSGDFEYEFLPEDENLKESYWISNGHISFHPRKRKVNSRLLIKIKI